MKKRILVLVIAIVAICTLVLAVVTQTQRGTQTKKVKSKADKLYENALAKEDNQPQEAIKVYEELIALFPEDKKAVASLYRLGELYGRGGFWQEAKDAYVKIVDNYPDSEQIADAQEKIWQTNIQILFSPITTEKDVIHKVEPGDTLVRIAQKYNTTADLIMLSNNLKGTFIRPGERLKICGAKFSVIVDKSQNTLILKADDEIYKVYPVATGKHNCTPTGIFTIVEKLKNPDWYKKGEGIIPANSPENILGTRWLGLSEPQYGIHGGAKEEDLGQQVTEGCIRMLNTEVEELFTILPRGTEVTIAD